MCSHKPVWIYRDKRKFEFDGTNKLETVMCLLVWILTIYSSVLCVLIGMLRSVNVMLCLM